MAENTFFNNSTKYIIFDMDGVLIDSEPVSVKSAMLALSEIGIYAQPKDFTPYIGTGEKNFIKYPCTFHGKEDLIPSATKRFYELFGELAPTELIVFPEVNPLLNRLKTLGLGLSIASSSAHKKLMQSLDAAKIPKSLFDTIISGDDVKDKKPSPEIYMTAIQSLGASPKDCLVVEDALSGVQAAKNAGCRCFAVTTSFGREQLKASGADFVGDNITEVLNWL